MTHMNRSSTSEHMVVAGEGRALDSHPSNTSVLPKLQTLKANKEYISIQEVQLLQTFHYPGLSST